MFTLVTLWNQLRYSAVRDGSITCMRFTFPLLLMMTFVCSPVSLAVADDATPPEVDGVEVTKVADTTVTMTWTTE